MVQQEQKTIILEEGIEDFSNQYISKIEGKESFDIKDIKEAFIAGAKWMKDFSAVTDDVFRRMF